MANPNSPDPYGPYAYNREDEDLVTRYKPLLQKLSISSIAGYCSECPRVCVPPSCTLL